MLKALDRPDQSIRRNCHLSNKVYLRIDAKRRMWMKPIMETSPVEHGLIEIQLSCYEIRLECVEN